MLIQAVPVLPAQQIDETLQFFAQRLGFAIHYQDQEYGIIGRDQVEIHFWRCEERQIAENSSCRILVQGIAALYQDCTAQQILHPNAALETKPWGAQEFAIVDLNGNLIWFVERQAN